MIKQKLAANLILFLFMSMFAGLMFSGASATSTVPVGTRLSMPYYNTWLDFSANQTFNDIYLEASSNATYPNYWFLTLGTSKQYGLQSPEVNFTVSTLFTGTALVYYQYSSGTVNIYCGDLGQPTSCGGASSTSYNAATKVYSVLALGFVNVSVSWSVSPTPAPTAAPSPVPTASPATIELTINQPTATTYNSGNILVSLSAVGGTVSAIWFNVQNSSEWVYPTAITYTAPYQLTGFANGSYTLWAYCNNTAGYSDSASIAFTVAIPSGGYSPGLPTVTIGRPQNITYVVSSIYIQISSTNADAVWYNVKNGSNWVYTYNQTYTSATSKTGFANGSYTFYAFAANGYGGIAQDTVVFSVGASGNVVLPQVNLDNFWLFLYEGNFLGFVQAYLIGVFFSLDAAIALIAMLLMVPIYLRTKSLMLLCVLWMMLGGFFIAAMPLASGIAVLFIVLGISGLIWRLFRSNSYS